MIIDGKKLASEILAELKKVSLREISRKEKIGKLPRRLSVGAVLVGENPASRSDIKSERGSLALRAAESFLKQKAKVAGILNIDFKIFRFKSNITTSRLSEEIKKLNISKNINGIIVQLPLPKHIKTEMILADINPKKDIDALSSAQILDSKIRADKKNPKVLSPIVEAVKYIFHKYKINYKTKNILIVGRGRLVGQPIYNWLSPETNKVVAIDIKQKNQLSELARKADIIISGAGKAGLITDEMIRKNAILIDFGFSRKNERIEGDFDFNSCFKKAKFITPVPGGMGPIMVAMLFKNLFKLNKK